MSGLLIVKNHKYLTPKDREMFYQTLKDQLNNGVILLDRYCECEYIPEDVETDNPTDLHLRELRKEILSKITAYQARNSLSVGEHQRIDAIYSMVYSVFEERLNDETH